MLKLIIRTPESIVCTMALATSFRLERGNLASSLPSLSSFSWKIVYETIVHEGHIAGIEWYRFPHKIPATNVPCIQSILSTFLHAIILDLLIVRIFEILNAG